MSPIIYNKLWVRKNYPLFRVMVLLIVLLIGILGLMVNPFPISISNTVVPLSNPSFQEIPNELFSNALENQLNDQDNLPFSGFIENRGQMTDPDLWYYYMQETYLMGFYESEIKVFTRTSSNDSWENLTITFPGASVSTPRGITKLTQVSNYFNRNPAVVGVSHWTEIWYESLYPGISLRFYANAQALKYDFILSPHVDPSIIQLQLELSTFLDMTLTPNCVRCTSMTEPSLILWQDHFPIANQMGNPAIEVTFRGIDETVGRYGFTVGEYDHTIELVIDPVILMWSTFLGGNGFDHSGDIAVDGEGCVYVTGYTNSPDFPMVNAYATKDENYDIFVTKFAANGQSLMYSTYLGGSGFEYGNDIEVDAMGCLYLTGETDSPDFPMVNAYNTTFKGNYNIFVTKFAADGKSLIFSTYLGESSWFLETSLAIDNEGCVYITGSTCSPNFPTKNAYDATYNGNGDTILVKLAADGQSLIYSTYFGGSSYEIGYSIQVDSFGCVYFTGETESSDLPIVNAYIANSLGPCNIYVTKLAADGQTIIFSTYLDGMDCSCDGECVQSLAIDTVGNVYVTYPSDYTNVSTVNAYDATANGRLDIIVTKLAADGQSLIYRTYLGGSGNDIAKAITIDTMGFLVIGGYTESPNFPTINAYDSTYNGEININGDAFLLKLTANGQSLIYNTYLGGSKYEWIDGIDIDTNGYVYITGLTVSTDFPLVNAYKRCIGKHCDVFVTKLDMDTDNDGMADSWETQMGLDIYYSGDAVLDKDTDGIPNLGEYRMLLNATDPFDATLDYDGDGLSNYEEYLKGSSPWIKDTDQDGWNDKLDPYPLDPIFPWLFFGCGLIFIGILGFIIVHVYRHKKKAT